MRKRLVFRCDDVGYTEAYDLGVFKVFDAGIGSSADVMFDSPHTVEALLKLRDYPWLSIGWHRHLWESPILPREEVPSLVDEEGRFKWRHRHTELMAQATYEDAYKEFKAEAELCKMILGRYPDIASLRYKDIPLENAFRDVLEELKIPYNAFSTVPGHPKKVEAKEEYRHLNYISLDITTGKGFPLEYFDEYEPLKTMTSPVWSEKEEVYFYGWHPGYCDTHILKESSCNLHRCKENAAALSDEFRNWIIDNHIELVNQRDVLYGTNEFQEHLKQIDSPLYIGNMRQR